MDRKSDVETMRKRPLEDVYREVFGERCKDVRDDRIDARRGFEKFSLYRQSRMVYSASTRTL